jgi:hypothetical protein
MQADLADRLGHKYLLVVHGSADDKAKVISMLAFAMPTSSGAVAIVWQ